MAELHRQLDLKSAIALNMLEMIGVGPFITLPLIVAAMGGPQAMLGWVLGALLAVCDGLVWAELGAAMPEAGGSYKFLQQIYGPKKAGRAVSFLFVWQYMLSGPLVIASGAVGLAQYASFLWPALRRTVLIAPLIGEVKFTNLLAIAACLLIMLLLYRSLEVIAKLARVLWAGSVLTLLAVIFAGFTHFHARQAFSFPPHAFQLTGGFFAGLASAMLIASYDYWGYYTICFVGGEVKDPGRTIPRSMLWSIAAIAVLYLAMNTSVLGVIPWQELVHDTQGDTRYAVVAVVMQRTFGIIPARIIALLVMWTAFGSLFAAMLGGSRVPYAAALDGNFFKPLGHVHAKGFPDRALLVLGGVACLCCFLRLATLIESMIAIRIVLTFLLQQVGVMILRVKQPELFRPFRMWLYPLPALVAIAAFVFILTARVKSERQIWTALAVGVTGAVTYAFRAWKKQEWPFAEDGGRE
jgi:APA family basic amino acid/polyamine antiporter